MTARTVQVVHCIDTEGPLYESIDATFERIETIFGLKFEPSRATLRKLQAGQIDLKGAEAAVQKVLDPQLLDYQDSWPKLDTMLDDMMSAGYRHRMTDSRGGGWVYNWFCVDHIGYTSNPRKRDIGYHNIFDHYRTRTREPASKVDGLHFHYHPHPFNGEAHRCATHWWANSDSLYQSISRRIIDRLWFPSANRPGFHVTRPDSHWFLEQYIPFDYASQAGHLLAADLAQAGVQGGRYGDWRRAPVTWEPYHPAPDDYQTPGTCRRWIARCLNVGTRYKLLQLDDVRQAFKEAHEGKPAILAFTNHDFRDMRTDVALVRDMLAQVSREYPQVEFAFAEAVDAMRKGLSLKYQPPCQLNISLSATAIGQHVLRVESPITTFGPQPWLALRTRAGDYKFDNFDTATPFHAWQYVLDSDTFPIEALSHIGIAANNAFGTASVVRLDLVNRTAVRKVLNDPGETDRSAPIIEGKNVTWDDCKPGEAPVLTI